MNIDEILELIDELLDDSWTLPFSNGKSVVDADKVRELIDNIRANLPGELKQAKLIVSDREDILRDAKKEAEMIIRNSQDKARAMVAGEEVSKQAREKATEIIQQAQSKAREIRNAATEFSDSMLKESEEMLSKNLRDVKSTRQALKTIRSKSLR